MKSRFSTEYKRKFLEEHGYPNFFAEALRKPKNVWGKFKKFFNIGFNIPWDFGWLSENPNITFDIMKENSDENWDWESLIKNASLSFEIIEEEEWLAENNRVNIDLVKENPDRKWNWRRISRNPNITLKDVKENPNWKWDWKGLSSNPNITFDFVKENSRKGWDWYRISKNKFFYSDTVFNREWKRKNDEKKEVVKKTLYESTDICPDIINEIVSWTTL